MPSKKRKRATRRVGGLGPKVVGGKRAGKVKGGYRRADPDCKTPTPGAQCRFLIRTSRGFSGRLQYLTGC